LLYVTDVQVIKENCSCVITVGALLTRRTVGILYILAKCFSQVRYVCYTSILCSPLSYSVSHSRPIY